MPNKGWQVVYQIVVPRQYHSKIRTAFGTWGSYGRSHCNKTYRKIHVLQNFTSLADVKSFCQSCHACQLVGKLNQNGQITPLKPIPAFSELFSQVIIDCVGPLPKTKIGHQYLLMIMFASTHFLEAIPLKISTIIKHLIKFFILVRLPKTVQSDQGSNFLAGVIQQIMHELRIKQILSSTYHPQTQGALEKSHQMLVNKNLLLKTAKGLGWRYPNVIVCCQGVSATIIGIQPFWTTIQKGSSWTIENPG